MAKNRNAVRAGIFMLLSVAGGIAIVIAIIGGAQFLMPYHTCHVGFALTDNVGGLRKGDDVRLGGFKVGTVTDIRFDKSTSRILVDFSIPTDDALASDAKIGVESSLTGLTALNITDMGSGAPLGDGDVLHGRPDALTAFRASLADLGPKLNADLDKVHETLDTYDKAGSKVQIDVHELATDLHARLKQVADSAQHALDSIHDWLGPSTGDFHQSVANVRDITGNLREKVPPITASMKELLDRLNATVAKAQGAVDDVKATVANAKEMTAVARSVVVRNQGRFDQIIAGIKKTSDNLDATSVEVRNSPWRLLYKPTPDEMANLNLYDAARQFADGANDLSDAAVALRDELKEQQPDPAKVQKMYDQLLEQFEKFQQAEDGLWKQVRQ
jgi:phospholipid/cholesterol/gamma-HCH transport system substrate-binding protein